MRIYYKVNKNDFFIKKEETHLTKLVFDCQLFQTKNKHLICINYE